MIYACITAIIIYIFLRCTRIEPPCTVVFVPLCSLVMSQSHIIPHALFLFHFRAVSLSKSCVYQYACTVKIFILYIRSTTHCAYVYFNWLAYLIDSSFTCLSSQSLIYSLIFLFTYCIYVHFFYMFCTDYICAFFQAKARFTSKELVLFISLIAGYILYKSLSGTSYSFIAMI